MCPLPQPRHARGDAVDGRLGRLRHAGADRFHHRRLRGGADGGEPTPYSPRHSCESEHQLGFARTALERGERPNLRGVRVALGTGNPGEGNRRASRNSGVRDLPPQIPPLTALLVTRSQASLRTDICPQRKESSSTSHARNPFNLNFFDSAQCLMVRRWRLIGCFPILYNPGRWAPH